MTIYSLDVLLSLFGPVCCSTSSSNCCSWPAYSFLQRQVRWPGTAIIWRIFQFVVFQTLKNFGRVSKEKLVFFWNSLFFDDPVDVGNLTSGSSAFAKSSLNIWNFTVHILLKPGLENFEYYFINMWDECNSGIPWTFFGNDFLWDCNENWLFPGLWPLLSFPNFMAYWAAL